MTYLNYGYLRGTKAAVCAEPSYGLLEASRQQA